MPDTDAIAYCRYSPKPDATDVQSLIVQEAACRAYAAIQGLTVVDVLTDPLTSGRKPLRKRTRDAKTGLGGGGAELAERVGRRRDQVRHVIAYKLDRLFRDCVDGLTMLKRWDKEGVTVHISQTGCSLNSKTPEGRLAIGMQLVMTQFEPEQTAARTRDSMRKQAKDGRSMSSICPYGKMPGTPEVIDGRERRREIDCPEEQAVIAKMIRWHGQGHSFTKIANMLLSEGVPNRGKHGSARGDWNRASVRRILIRAGVMGSSSL